jgi:colanic acid/amylovoran biosynthesis glycosyltransferase
MRGRQNPIACLRALRPARYGLPGSSLGPLFSAAPFLPRRRYDVIHCHFGPSGLRGVFLRRIGVLQGRLLTAFHGYDVHRYPREHGDQVYKPLFEHGDWFTVNSTFTGSRAEALGCPSDRITRIPEGFLPRKYQPKKKSWQPGDRVRVLTVGRLVEKKGIEFAIRAFAEVAARRKDVQYDIVGDGERRTSLQDLARSLGVADRVSFHGGMTEDRVRDLYDRCHLFMLTSVTAADGDQEGQGLVLQEAQAMRMPVLTTRHNGIPDGVLDGQSAFLVPERDVEATAERLQYLLDHPETWERMGAAGRKFVIEHFDINRLNDRVVEIYHQLLAN